MGVSEAWLRIHFGSGLAPLPSKIEINPAAPDLYRSVYIYIYLYVYIYIYVYVYAHIYIYIHTCINTVLLRV